MRVVLLSCFTLCFACDFGRNRAPDERPSVFNNSTLTGIVTLPAEMEGADTACGTLSILATAGKGGPLGDPSIHQSRGRCSYLLGRLPSDAELSLRAKAEGWMCRDGGEVTFAPDVKTVTLKDTETRTLDFKGNCTTARSAR